MSEKNVNLLFCENDSKLFPTVSKGFVLDSGFQNGDKVTFKWKGNFDDWRSQASSSEIDEYGFEITLDSFVYQLVSTGNSVLGEGKDDGTYELIPQPDSEIYLSRITLENGNVEVTVQNVPDDWDGIEFEYTVTMNGNGKEGSLDPRFRGGTSA